MPKEMETERPVSEEGAETEKAAEQENIERRRKLKQHDMKTGVSMMITAVVLRVVFVFVALVGDPDAVALQEPAIWIITAVMMFWGGWRVCKSKGRNGLLGYFGFFTLFLADRNRIEAPDRPGTGAKPPGAMFSDW